MFATAVRAFPYHWCLVYMVLLHIARPGSNIFPSYKDMGTFKKLKLLEVPFYNYLLLKTLYFFGCSHFQGFGQIGCLCNPLVG